MKFVVLHPDGRIEGGLTLVGDNFALGLGAVLHACLCGQREFVDASTDLPISEREPDRVCSCGRKFWYFDAADDHVGGLH